MNSYAMVLQFLLKLADGLTCHRELVLSCQTQKLVEWLLIFAEHLTAEFAGPWLYGEAIQELNSIAHSFFDALNLVIIDPG